MVRNLKLRIKYYSLLENSKNFEDIAQSADEYLKDKEFSSEQMETMNKLKIFVDSKSSNKSDN
jgi:hypothetical protein